MRTAIIGFGPHGKRLYEVCQRIREIDLVGIVDRNEEVLNSVPTLSKVTKFTDQEDMYLRFPDLEVLLIATNGPSHATLAIEAMQKGVRYILVEKPMACSVLDCQKMESKALETGTRLSVDKPYRFSPVFRFIRDNLLYKDWGRIRTIFIQAPGIGLGCLGTHWFDVSNFLMNQSPLKITAWLDSPKSLNPRGAEYVDPGGLVICEYQGEQRSVINQIEDSAGPISIEVHTTKVRVLYDPKNSFLDIRIRDTNVKPGPGKPAVYEHMPLPEDLKLSNDLFPQIEDVLRDLLHGNPMLADAKHGTQAVQMLVAAHVSHRRGNIPIPLPLTEEEDIQLFLPVT